MAQVQPNSQEAWIAGIGMCLPNAIEELIDTVLPHSDIRNQSLPVPCRHKLLRMGLRDGHGLRFYE